MKLYTCPMLGAVRRTYNYEKEKETEEGRKKGRKKERTKEKEKDGKRRKYET
jgi:hypothetical protein